MPKRLRALLLALLTALIAASQLATTSVFAAPPYIHPRQTETGSVSVMNGGFEQGLTGWVVPTALAAPNSATNDGVPFSGARALHLRGQVVLEQTIAVAPNATYLVSSQLQGLAPAGNPIWLWVIIDDGQSLRSGAEATGGVWRTVTRTVRTGATASRLTIRLQTPTRAADALADDLTITGPAPQAGGSPSATPQPAPTGTLPPALPTQTPVPPPGGGGISSSATAWRRWEQRLVASRASANPVTDVTLRATFTGPGEQSFTSQGFWESGSTFMVRAIFPAAGAWTWQTTASNGDPGLTQRGMVQVAAASGNVLQTRGALRVSGDGRYLIYADGTPFFWLGDTAWDAPLKATDAEWQQYLADRAAKGFSVVQIALAPRWSAATDVQGNAAFIGNNLRQPNPAFWRAFERKVQLANDAALVVLVVGLMDPLAENQPDVAAAQVVGRYVAARLAGSHVIFSATFDHPYQAIANATAQAIRAATPQHLVIQHPGTPSGQATNIWAQQYANQASAQLAGNQSGHNGSDRARVLRQAVQWNLSLWRRVPAKPVINLEAYYDAGGLVPAIHGGAFQGTAWDARAAGYLSLLSGASGYSYGAYGLWSWGGEPFHAVPWRTALAFPSSRQMTILRTTFASLPWWQLQPAYMRILTATNDPTRQPIMAITSDGAAGIAYLPAALPIQIDMAGFSRAVRASWVNPQTGARTVIGSVPNTGSRSFTPPAGGVDWVLVFA